MSACTVCGLALGQEKGVNPFEDPDIIGANLIPKGPKTWEVMVEVFSLPFADASILRREVKGAGKAYDELVKRVDQKKAALEEFFVIKGGVGEKARRLRLKNISMRLSMNLLKCPIRF